MTLLLNGSLCDLVSIHVLQKKLAEDEILHSGICFIFDRNVCPSLVCNISKEETLHATLFIGKVRLNLL